VEVVGADEVVAEHGPAHQPGDRGVETGAGDEEVVARPGDGGAPARVGHDGEAGVETGRGGGLVELALDGALARPPVDELEREAHVARLHPAHGHGVEASVADDRHAVVRPVEPGGGQEVAADQDADRRARPGQRHQHHVGSPQRQHALGGDGDPEGRAPRAPHESSLEHLEVLGCGLVLDRQVLAVVATLAQVRLALLEPRLERPVAQIGEQERDVLDRVRPERHRRVGQGSDRRRRAHRSTSRWT
jgi:hypothetical protein